MKNSKKQLPPNVKRLTCLFCKHFYFCGAEPGYSEYTPGSDAAMECTKNYWSMNNLDTTEDLRIKMLSAETCADFEMVDLQEITK